MTEIFIRIVNASIAASWLVLAIVILRFALRKAPKWVSVLLWGFVAIRLICPFSIESMFSLIPSAETIRPEIMTDATPEIHTGIQSLNSILNPVVSGAFTPEPLVSINPLQLWIPLAAIAWIVGCAGMLLYTAVSYFLLQRKVGTAVLLKNNIYQSENVGSPFVLGIIKPKIYLPFHMDSKNIEHVISHEEAHIRRKDHLWKPLGFLLLTLHWFNPIMWLGYILLCRDIELACDEKVIKELDNDSKADYAQALVACSVNRRSIAACPLAFGEVGVKERVKSIMNYKKPAFWIIVAAIITCIVVAVCFLTNPAARIDEKLSVFIDCQIAGHFQNEKSEGNACCVNWEVLGTKKRGSVISVYMWVLYEEYSLRDGQLYNETGTHIATLITVKKENGAYKLIEYWEPRDGAFLEPGIREKFPWHLQHKALDSQRYIRKQKAENLKIARDYFSLNVDTPVSNSPAPESKLVPYYQLSDGTWQAKGRTYQYRLVITGRMHNAASDSTFVYLSNIEKITFDQAWRAAGFSSNTEDYFSLDEAILVEWLQGDITEIGGADHPATGALTDSTGTIVAVENIDNAISKTILQKNAGDRFPDAAKDFIPVEAHYMLGITSASGTPAATQTNYMEGHTVYVQYVYNRYGHSGGALEKLAGIATPAMITFTGNSEEGYTLKEFWEPTGGSTYAAQIREKFPVDIADLILNSQKVDMDELEYKCLEKAQQADTESVLDNCLENVQEYVSGLFN